MAATHTSDSRQRQRRTEDLVSYKHTIPQQQPRPLPARHLAFLPPQASTPMPANERSRRQPRAHEYMRQRWHVSFARALILAALIAVATLSWKGVRTGMRTQTQSSPSLKHLRNDKLLPVKSRSTDEQTADDISDETGAPPIGSGSNGKQVSVDMSNEDNAPSPNDEQVSDDHSDDADALHDDSQSPDEENVDERSGETDELSASDHVDDEIPSPGNMGTEVRHFFNKKKERDNTVSSQSLNFPRIVSLDGDKDIYLRGKSDDEKRVIGVSKQERKEQKRLLDSNDFRYRDPLYEGDCVPMQKWQETSFPNCNMFHELDFYGKSLTNEFEYYTNGGYNHIFYLNETDRKDDPGLALKSLKYGTAFTDRNFDRVRRDGLILERLTKSPFVLDTYGFCGFDVLTPFADGGTLSDKLRLWSKGGLKLSRKERLKIATEVSAGLAAVHDIDGEGLSSVAHGDLKGQQYLFLNGKMKLGDFNRGRFLRRNSTAPLTACTYTIGKNDAAFRSPEEYEYLPQTSAIDVYALGSILYKVLTGDSVWDDTDMKKAQKLIRKGKLPKIDDKYLDSADPVYLALREAIGMCYVFDPKERATAADVYSYLKKKLSELSKV